MQAAQELCVVSNGKRFDLCAAGINSPINIFPLYITEYGLLFPKIPINFYFATVPQLWLAETDTEGGSEVQKLKRDKKRER
jgi:hypothetical protein